MSEEGEAQEEPQTAATERPAWLSPRHPLFLVVTLLAIAYVAVVASQRFEKAFDPWRAETDMKQVTFQYYRYYVDGALERGHLMTDYAAVYNAPPFFHAVMAPLSTFIDPKVAASAVNVFLWLGALLALYVAVRVRSNHYVGLAAAVLLAHSAHFFRITAGGYARTFGPTLLVCFIAAWLAGKRRLCLVILVIQAGTYPPVMMPSALAFGVYTLWRFYKDREWRPVVELAVTAVLVLAFAFSQSLLAPDWWGGPLSYEEALKNPAFRGGSRMPFVPHPPLWTWPWRYFDSLFRANGHMLFDWLMRWDKANYHALVVGPFVVAMGIAIARRPKKFPWELVGLFVAAFVSYLLARALAFRLHIPHRPLAHGWPYILAAIIPLAYWLAFSSLLKSRRALATLLAVTFTLAPVGIVLGDGIASAGGYRSYERDKPLYLWLRAHTPLDAVFGGNFQPLDEIPLFAWRIPYVNWKLAHPFRPGYWDEVVRRTKGMYRAFYATEYSQVLDFAEREKVDYLITDRRRFKRLERGDGQLFPPLRGMVAPMFRECRRKGCVLENPPPEAVVFTHRNYRVIDLAKLRALADRGDLPGYEKNKPPPLDPPPNAPAESAESADADAGPPPAE